jgi:hypothetical protein
VPWDQYTRSPVARIRNRRFNAKARRLAPIIGVRRRIGAALGLTR